MYNPELPPEEIEKKGEVVLPPEQDFEKAFADGVPEFTGFGVVKDESNEYYGDLTSEEQEQIASEEAELNQAASVNGEPEKLELENTDPEVSGYDPNLVEASAIVNYVDAAARKYGVGPTVEKIKYLNENSDDPIGDLYREFGIDTKEELKEVNDESLATRNKVEGILWENNLQEIKERNKQNARQAIRAMKDLITEVEETGPQYAKLREEAARAGKGVFDYAVENLETQGLAEAFSVLSKQKVEETKEEKEEKENPDSSEVPSVETPPEDETIIPSYLIGNQQEIDLVNQKNNNINQ